MFVKVRRAFTVGAVAFLLFLFTVPSLYLKAKCQALNERCDAVLSAVAAGDATASQAAYRSLQTQYEAMRRRAELFMDHRVMDDATVPLALMGVYLDAADGVALQTAAAEFRQALSCLLAIETADPRLLL